MFRNQEEVESQSALFTCLSCVTVAWSDKLRTLSVNSLPRRLFLEGLHARYIDKTVLVFGATFLEQERSCPLHLNMSLLLLQTHIMVIRLLFEQSAADYARY